MPDFNFMPAITQINFYRDQRGLKEDEHITEVVLEPYVENESPDVFELHLEFTLSGLNMLKNPLSEFMLKDGHYVDSIYEPFYIHVATFTQRGQRDIIIHGVDSHYVSEELLKEKHINLINFIGKFRNDEPFRFNDEESIIDYDFVSRIYFVKIFYSQHKIENEEELSHYMWEPHYNLFETKLPIKMNYPKGESNEK